MAMPAGFMVDAVDPANIPADFDGGLALVVTVLANPAGQAFDVEPGNAPALKVGASMALRQRRGFWSILYADESLMAGAVTIAAQAGCTVRHAADWPQPGVYLWCADPDRRISSGDWQPGYAPLLVQDAYTPTVDTSQAAPHFPATVAGYMDGPRSQWPAAAWKRFRTLLGTYGDLSPEQQPAPAPTAPPTPSTPLEATTMILLHTIEETGRVFLVTEHGVSDELDAPTVAGLLAAGVPSQPATLAGIGAIATPFKGVTSYS